MVNVIEEAGAALSEYSMWPEDYDDKIDAADRMAKSLEVLLGRELGHDLRVSELLAANNVEVERRRVAERHVATLKAMLSTVMHPALIEKTLAS